MSMCLVRDVGFPALAIAVHTSLSSYSNDVAADYGTPMSHTTLLRNKIIILAWQAAMNSASLLNYEVLGYSYDL